MFAPGVVHSAITHHRENTSEKTQGKWGLAQATPRRAGETCLSPFAYTLAALVTT